MEVAVLPYNITHFFQTLNTIHCLDVIWKTYWKDNIFISLNTTGIMIILLKTKLKKVKIIVDSVLLDGNNQRLFNAVLINLVPYYFEKKKHHL